MASPGHERRAEFRRNADADVAVRAYRMAPLPAILRDISTGGAMLKVDDARFDIGDEVVLTCRDIEIVATIAWRKKTFFGLAFHRHLDPREIRTLRQIHHAEQPAA
jgi:hypothetical protein